MANSSRDRSTAPSPAEGEAQVAAVIANPTKIDVDALMRAVREAERANGWGESILIETDPDDPGFAQAQSALEQGASVVLAAGGDGTVRAVAEALVDTDATLAVIPAGTGNLLARNIGLDPSDLADAVKVAFSGHSRAIDVGTADVEREDGSRESTVFTVLCGVGVDAAMLANTDDDLKKRVGWIAYVGGIFRSIGQGSRLKLRFRIDDRRTRGTYAHTFMVANCGLLPGNVVLLPDAVIDDGELDTAILRPRGPFGWVELGALLVMQSGVLYRIRRRTRHEDPGTPSGSIDFDRGKDVVVRLDSGPEAFELDGDPFGEIVAARIRVRHRALSVSVPVPTPETPAGAADAALNRFEEIVTDLITGGVAAEPGQAPPR